MSPKFYFYCYFWEIFHLVYYFIETSEKNRRIFLNDIKKHKIPIQIDIFMSTFTSYFIFFKINA